MILILDVVLCAAITVVAVAPLAWAILTQDRDHSAVTVASASVATVEAARRAPRPQHARGYRGTAGLTRSAGAGEPAR